MNHLQEKLENFKSQIKNWNKVSANLRINKQHVDHHQLTAFFTLWASQNRSSLIWTVSIQWPAFSSEKWTWDVAMVEGFQL